MQRDQRFFCPPTCPNKWYFGSNNFGPPQTSLRAFSGPAGPKNGFFGRILLRHGRTEGRTEKTWTCIGKLSQSRRKKVIVTKCVARTAFPLRTVERRPRSIFYPPKNTKLAISKWKMFTFLPKQCLGMVNSKGLAHRCVNPDFGPKWDVLRVLRVLRAPRATPNTRTRPHESWDHF